MCVEHHWAAGPAGLIFTFLSAASVLLFVVVWRRSPGPQDDGGEHLGANVSLSCPRCGRVVELPREHARGARFCPRCGATLSGDA